MLKDLLRYRYFIASSVRNDLVRRFVRSKLGGVWVILNPLAQVAIYALILSNILSAKLPGIDNKYAYAIYLMSGLLAWGLFNDIMERCLNLFIKEADVIKKTCLPRVTLPVISLAAGLLNNLLLFIPIVFIFLILGHHFSLYILWLIPLTVNLGLFAIGLGLSLGIINVFIRDIGQIMPIVMQILFWFTPIVYPVAIIPESYRHFLAFNPLYHFVDAYRAVMVYGTSPRLSGVLIVAVISTFLLMFSLLLFRRSSAEMADVL